MGCTLNTLEAPACSGFGWLAFRRVWFLGGWGAAALRRPPRWVGGRRGRRRGGLFLLSGRSFRPTSLVGLWAPGGFRRGGGLSAWGWSMYEP